MKRYKIVLLFVVTIFVCLFAGTILGVYISIKGFSISSFDSLPHHHIDEKDIVALSEPKQFSGRIMFPNDGMGRDVIPDDTTAVRMGLQLLASVYGDDVYDEKPYNVALIDSVWIVETSILPPPFENMDLGNGWQLSYLVCGGVGHVEMNKHNGKVYTVYHTK